MVWLCRWRRLGGAGLTGLCGVLFALAGSAQAAFPGRNGLLAVQPLTERGILLVSPNGLGKRRICVGIKSACADPSDERPRWSADGQRLVLSTGSTATGGALVVYQDGSCLDCQPIQGGAAGFMSNPSLITVVFGGDLIEYGVDGIRRAVVLSGGVSAASWSSRGDLAAVRRGALWVGRPGSLRRLGSGSQPSWSPRGKKIAFVRGGWVMIAPVRGQSSRRLVRGSAPAWSPDGRSIAFIGRAHRVSIVASAAGRTRRVGTVRGLAVDWQPAPAQPGPSCAAPPGSQVMASGDGAIVTSDGGPAVPFGDFAPVAYMGCPFTSGRERLLVRDDFQNEDTETGATDAAADGNYGALGTFETDVHYGGSTSSVAVYDLRSGKLLPNLGREGMGCEGYSCTTSVDDLAINSQGFTAVHLMAGCCPTGETIQVSDSNGPRTVDSAGFSSGKPTLTELVLTGDTLTWKHGGTPESTQLH